MWVAVSVETHGFPTTPESHFPLLSKSHRKKIRLGSVTTAVKVIVSPSNVFAPPYGPPALSPPAVGAGPALSVLGSALETNDRPLSFGTIAASNVRTWLYWFQARPLTGSYCKMVGSIFTFGCPTTFSFTTIP